MKNEKVLSKLFTVTVQKTMEKVKEGEDFTEIDFYDFWDELKTPEFKACYLHGLKNWRNGKDFLKLIYPKIKAQKGSIKDGNTIIEQYENIKREDLISIYLNNLQKENIKSAEMVAKICKLSKKELNLL
jgi:hypothetical protein